MPVVDPKTAIELIEILKLFSEKFGEDMPVKILDLQGEFHDILDIGLEGRGIGIQPSLVLVMQDGVASNE